MKPVKKQIFTKKRFEELVEKALDSIPKDFLAKMENVEIFVEDECPPELDDGESDLLGLYEGVPITERGENNGPFVPDRITIYRKPILRISKSERRIVFEIKKTIIHEVGHFFGMTDDEIYQIMGE